MTSRPLLTIAALLGLTALGACASASRSLGLAKVTPDEFRVVTKAPLTLPPDYSLRPPMPGQPRPAELQPESAARTALLGQRSAEQRSDGEKLLASKAGADKADPLIRYVVDDEFGSVAHKEPSFADRVMFWRGPKLPGTPDTGADQVANVDPVAEADRIAKLTGGKPVIIERKAPSKIKLPGL